MNFSLQIEFSFPTGLSSYCQIFNLCILSSLINFSDHFLSTSASYYYLFFNFFRLYIYLCIIIIVIIVIIIILFILFYYLLLLFFCYYYIFFIFIFIFIFVWGPKNGLQQMPPLTEQGFCEVSFIKINQTELPKLIWSKLDRSETLSLQQSSSAPKKTMIKI